MVGFSLSAFTAYGHPAMNEPSDQCDAVMLSILKTPPCINQAIVSAIRASLCNVEVIKSSASGDELLLQLVL